MLAVEGWPLSLQSQGREKGLRSEKVPTWSRSLVKRFRLGDSTKTVRPDTKP